MPFGSLEVGDHFYVRGEFWTPRERHEAIRGAVRESVREVRRDEGGLELWTNEPGVFLA